jgi:hypothetical protein
MSIVQDLYTIYDKEQSKYRARKSSQGLLLTEIRHNLAFLREGLREGLTPAAIVAGLEDAHYRDACRQGVDLDALQKKKLAPDTFANIREFARYHGWSTSRLIGTVYERIATLKKLVAGSAEVALRVRLKNLFKLLMVVLAHLEGRQLKVPASR